MVWWKPSTWGNKDTGKTGDSSKLEKDNTYKPSPSNQNIKITKDTPQIGSPTITQQESKKSSGGGSSNKSGGGSSGSSSRNILSSTPTITATPNVVNTSPNNVVSASFVSGGSASGQGGIIQDTATGGTMSNRPASPSISSGGELSSYAGTYKQSYFSATKQSIGNIFADIGAIATGKNYVGDWFSPFESTGIEKSKQTAYYKPNYGTIQTTGFDISSDKLLTTSAYTPVTFFDVQKETELKRGIEYSGVVYDAETKASSQFKKYQDRINAGEDYSVVLKESQDFLSNLNTDASSRASAVYNKYPDVQGFTIRSGSGIKEGIKIGGETAGLIGLSLTGPAGAAAASAYIFGQGYKQTIEAPTLGGKAVGIATVGLGLAGFKSATNMIETSIVNAEINSLADRPLQFKQIQIVNEDKSTVLFEATQKQGQLTRTFVGKGDVFKEGQNMFILPKGDMAIRTTGQLSWNIFGPSKTMVFSQQTGNFGVKGISNQIGNFNIAASKSAYVPKTSTSIISGIDISKGIPGRFVTDVKLFGPPTKARTFTISKNTAPDIFGNQRYASVATGMKGKRLTRPAQMGVTTVIEGKGFSGSKYAKEAFDDFNLGGKEIGTPTSRGKKMLGFSNDGASKEIVVQSIKTDTLQSPLGGGLKFGKISRGISNQITMKQTLNLSPQNLLSSSYNSQSLAIKQTQQPVPIQMNVQGTQLKQESFMRQSLVYPTQELIKSSFGSVSIQGENTAQEVIGSTKLINTPTFVSRISPPPIKISPKFDIPFPFGLPSFGFDEGKRPSRKYKGKRKYKYTPSYEAVIFGIKGKKPKGLETGARIRPLTKDFKPFKMPSFKLNIKGGKF